MRRLLADHDARRVGIPGDDEGHDGGVRHTQPGDVLDPGGLGGEGHFLTFK